MGSKVILGIVIFIIIAILIAMFFVARNIQTSNTSGSKQDNNKSEETTVEKRLVSILEINHNPYVYEGVNVEMNEQLSDWATKKSFYLSITTGGSAFGGGTTEKLLVVAEEDYTLATEVSPTKLGLGETGKVKLKGKVQFVDRATLESLLGVSLDNEILKRDDSGISNWDKGDVIILESIEKIQE